MIGGKSECVARPGGVETMQEVVGCVASRKTQRCGLCTLMQSGCNVGLCMSMIELIIAEK